MKLSQFIQKYPNRMFVRFFYDIEYDYGVTRHVCVYMKYENNDLKKSAENFYRLFNIWSIGQMDNKQKIKGYDRVFVAKQLLKQFKNCEKYNVQNEDGQYYFLEII